MVARWLCSTSTITAAPHVTAPILLQNSCGIWTECSVKRHKSGIHSWRGVGRRQAALAVIAVYSIFARYAQAYFPSFTLHSAHMTHTYQLPSSLWAGALDRLKKSQRWGPAKNERTNERFIRLQGFSVTVRLVAYVSVPAPFCVSKNTVLFRSSGWRRLMQIVLRNRIILDGKYSERVQILAKAFLSPTLGNTYHTYYFAAR